MAAAVSGIPGAPCKRQHLLYGFLQQCNRRSADSGGGPGRWPVRMGRHQPSGRIWK